MKRLKSVYVSEPDLTTADNPEWKNSGFPPGFTVDELRFSRRRRPPGDTQSKDHLGLDEGNFNNLKTEYRRRFRDYYDPNTCKTFLYNLKDLSPTRSNKPDDHLTFADDEEDGEPHTNVLRPEYRESFIQYEFPSEQQHRTTEGNSFRRYKRHLDQDHVQDWNTMGTNDVSRSLYNPKSENKSQYIQYDHVERQLPMRRATSLKLEGDFTSTTEKAEQFIKYLLAKRRSLIKNPSNLKLEGTMDNKHTETRDQYIPLEILPRPPLYKKLTNLRLEGDMDINTESSEQFIPYAFEERPPLIKRNTYLHLEGDLLLSPEYQHEYKGLTSERSSPSLPRHNLKVDGFFDTTTENQSSYVMHQVHPPIPFLRGSAFNKKLLLGEDTKVFNPEYRDQFVPYNIEGMPTRGYKRGENLSMEGQFGGVSENRYAFKEQSPVRTEMWKAKTNLQLEGQLDMNPEYKNAYVDYYKTKDFSSPIKQRRHAPRSSLKFEGGIEGYPEYRRSYVDFPRRRPSPVKKHENNLSSEGEMDTMTEKRAQYIEYPGYHKANAMKPNPEFKLEGNFECQPEYRKAYINYLIRERVDHKHRPLDNLTGIAMTPPKRAFEVLTPAAPTTDATTTTTSSTESKAKSMIPIARKNSSGIEKFSNSSTTAPPASTTTAEDTDKNNAYSSSTNSKIPRRQISINTLETQLFGPKIEMPKGIRSRSSSRLNSRTPSPLPPKGTRTRSLSRSSRTKGSSSEQENMSSYGHRDRTGSRFSNVVRVEDLAYTPATSPIPTHKIYSYNSRKKWDKSYESSSIGDKIDRMTAFMVIDDKNNNEKGFLDRNRGFYKEQKWMSSWDSPTL